MYLHSLSISAEHRLRVSEIRALSKMRVCSEEREYEERMFRKCMKSSVSVF
jgi:hypothetical protein